MTSVIFLPDVWNALPTQKEYDEIRRVYLRKHNAEQSSPTYTPGACDTEAAILAAGKLKVSELRAELKKRNIPLKGMKKKVDLHNALVSAIKRGGGDERNNKGEQTARGNLSFSSSSTPDLPEDRAY